MKITQQTDHKQISDLTKDLLYENKIPLFYPEFKNAITIHAPAEILTQQYWINRMLNHHY